ncbi:hypothetical protein [Jannaschia pohangensis]|uniref:YARHG domain-containing protein n=1 Tax=Jannaschia pohangensis TaxID=390807 RepID=A0A1I3Q759_9RHOB|nr:hypothetical protein [Jannaschia pohangensis]SFJ29505.1 hypothetical protein SAMN04488095_2434 [Jannaschia pohangensis]
MRVLVLLLLFLPVQLRADPLADVRLCVTTNLQAEVDQRVRDLFFAATLQGRAEAARFAAIKCIEAGLFDCFEQADARACTLRLAAGMEVLSREGLDRIDASLSEMSRRPARVTAREIEAARRLVASGGDRCPRDNYAAQFGIDRDTFCAYFGPSTTLRLVASAEDVLRTERSAR